MYGYYESARFGVTCSCECFVGATTFMPILTFHAPQWALNHNRLHIRMCFGNGYGKAFLSPANIQWKQVCMNSNGSVFPLCCYFPLFCQSIECKSIRGMYFRCMAHLCDRESASATEYSQSEWRKTDHNTEQRALRSREKRMHLTQTYLVAN